MLVVSSRVCRPGCVVVSGGSMLDLVMEFTALLVDRNYAVVVWAIGLWIMLRLMRLILDTLS